MINKKILVTGGDGFIGSHLVDAYLQAGHQVVVVDNLSINQGQFLNKKVKFYQTDITHLGQIQKIITAEKPDVINHHAGHVNVGNSINNPLYDHRHNLLATINLLEAAAKNKTKQFIFASSGGAIYGNSKRAAQEKTAVNILSPYAAAKKAAETYIQVYSNLYPMQHLIFRYSNIYGPRQSLKSQAVITNFIHHFLRGETPIIYEDGTQTRNFLYIDDVITANLLALDYLKSSTFNIAANQSHDINTLFDLVKANFPKKENLKAKYQETSNNPTKKSHLSNNKAQKKLNWKPLVDLKQGLKKTIAWYKKNDKS